jgi:hypothetical protein
METSRHYVATMQAFMALQHHQLDSCTELLLVDHHTDHELPIAGQAILSIVFLRMEQVSKAAAWFGTLFLEYSAESHLRTWYDLLDHVLIAEYLVEILIDDPRRRPRSEMSITIDSYVLTMFCNILGCKSLLPFLQRVGNQRVLT